MMPMIARAASRERCDAPIIYKDIVLIQDVTYIVNSEGAREYDGNEIKYDYSIVLTQECDLEKDYKNRTTYKVDQDKYIPMILMVPAYLAGSLRNGNHLEVFKQKMRHINSDDWGKVKSNENKRYHYLLSDINKNVPELVVDFKHYFTISRDIFYQKAMNLSYLASVTILYREELSQRFCNFISRIGIPDTIKDAKLLTESLCSIVSPKLP